jgi:hypothetical protein
MLHRSEEQRLGFASHEDPLPDRDLVRRVIANDISS